jgi:hypothetical protein
MKLVNRIFLVILVGCGVVWMWATWEFGTRAEADREFEKTQLAPAMEKSRQQSAAFRQVLQDRKEGKRTPLPNLEWDMVPLNEAVARMKRRNHYREIQSLAVAVALGTISIWSVALFAGALVRNRRWESVDRQPLAEAGKVLGRFLQDGSRLEARDGDGSGARNVSFDARRMVVEFRNFSFVDSFARNPRRDRVELPISALLTGTVHYAKGGRTLHLRTTLGKVAISDQVRPFDELAALLLDICEYNRLSPVEYRAARALEPQVSTPWYGWVLLAAGLGGIIAGGWWLMGVS